MMKKQAAVKTETPVTAPAASDSVGDESSGNPQAPSDPLLDQAERHLENGEYARTLDSVTRALAESQIRDEVFFNRALGILVQAMAHTDNPADDGKDAMVCFDELDEPFPGQGAAARCWLEVLDELLILKSQLTGMKTLTRIQKNRIVALEQQLEQLKAVDLELGTPETENERHEP